MNSDAVSSSGANQGHLVPGDDASTAPCALVAPTNDDTTLLEALRSGDETAFATLVKRYHPSLYRLALTYVHDAAVAQEAVQDTWVGVLKGIDSFESHATLKTWIFRILINRAKTSAAREGRIIPFSEAWDAADDADEPAVAPDRFVPPESATGRPAWWASPPIAWSLSPEETILTAETRAYLASR